MAARPTVLTIAGSDCCGGAGIQADLKTFHQHGVHGASVVTLITAQNTDGISHVEPLAPSLVAAQLHAVLSDMQVSVIKIGALGTGECVEMVASILLKFQDIRVVLDTVVASKNGRSLLDTVGLEAFRSQLMGRATVLTPNRVEAAMLTHRDTVADTDKARASVAEELLRSGCGSVLLKGGHFESSLSADELYRFALQTSGDRAVVREVFASPRISNVSAHGTGCTLAAAIAANLALGHDVHASCAMAHGYVHRAIEGAPAAITRGANSMLDHFAKPR
jgi:hydroxymethylpyrimidine/phosphomethylpyrimidine kinase